MRPEGKIGILNSIESRYAPKKWMPKQITSEPLVITIQTKTTTITFHRRLSNELPIIRFARDIEDMLNKYGSILK